MQLFIVSDALEDSTHVLENGPRFRTVIPLGAEYIRHRCGLPPCRLGEADRLMEGAIRKSPTTERDLVAGLWTTV